MIPETGSEDTKITMEIMEVMQLQRRIEELEEVLEQYADEDNWEHTYGLTWRVWKGESGPELAKKVLKK